MSKVENVNSCYICDLAFKTRTQFVKHNLSDEHSNRARKEYDDDVEDETSHQIKMTTFSDLKIYEVALLIILRILLKLKLKLKLTLKLKQILMIISTPELSMNVKDVMKNLGIK